MIYYGNGITIVLFGIYNSSIITTRPEFVPIYGFFLVCEIVGFLYSFSIELILLKIVFTCQTFHKNLLNAFGVFVAQHILSQAGRLVLMCYQFGVLKITGNFLLDLPLLIFSTYRMYFYVGAITFLSSLIIERFMATIYIKDYEKVRRVWIQFIIHTNAFIAQFAASILYCKNGADGGSIFLILLFLAVFWMIFVFWAFRKIHQSNSKSLTSLLAHYELNKYSLSARFQLEENVRSMKVIKKIFYIHGAFCLFATALFTIPHVLYEESGAERELGIAALEAIQGIYGILFHSFLINIIPTWRARFLKIFEKFFPKKKYTSEIHSVVISPPVEDEGNIYFRILSNSWT